MRGPRGPPAPPWLLLAGSPPARPREGEDALRRGRQDCPRGARGVGRGAGPSPASEGRAGGGVRLSGQPCCRPAFAAEPGWPGLRSRLRRAPGKVTATGYGVPGGCRRRNFSRAGGARGRVRVGVPGLLGVSTSHCPQRAGCARRRAPLSLGEGGPFPRKAAAWRPSPSRRRGRIVPAVSLAT